MLQGQGARWGHKEIPGLVLICGGISPIRTYLYLEYRPSTCVCVCVLLLYSVQLGSQRSPLSTTGNFDPSTQLNYNQSLVGDTRKGRRKKGGEEREVVENGWGDPVENGPNDAELQEGDQSKMQHVWTMFVLRETSNARLDSRHEGSHSTRPREDPVGILGRPHRGMGTPNPLRSQAPFPASNIR